MSEERLPRVVVFDAAGGGWQSFSQLRKIVATDRCGDVLDCLGRVERLVEQEGLHAAGFVSYEAAPAFDRALVVRESTDFPFVWFGLFARRETIGELPVGWTSESVQVQKADGLGGPSYEWQASIAPDQYAATVERLRAAIAAGETYQVNYTFRFRAAAVEPQSLFQQLIAAQPAPYAAFIETEQFAVCSASPELFFSLDGNRIATRPMKGTAARGRWPEEDRRRAAALAASEKDRAENAMIVDMLRNDLGRIARRGSVQVSDLFRVERYPTLWQMTSCVSAETQAPLAEIFAAMFPCASVTGAPKANTMRIIASAETAPRRIYTGSIGTVSPGRRAVFNVAIRTALVDKLRGEAEYGVGGGVVWDSTPAGEYQECLLKARVLTERRVEFSLLETMLWKSGEGIWLLDEHLRRLQGSAEYFDIPLDMAKVTAVLDNVSGTLRVPMGSGTPPASGYPVPDTLRIRLLVDRSGGVTCETRQLEASELAEPIRLELAAQPVDETDIFLFHKTTHRKAYDDARAGCKAGDDVLLYNRRGEVTETCRANVAVRIGADLFTPSLECGLLAGTLRARLLSQGKLRERTIPLELLASCDEIFSLNSVRGLQRAMLLHPPR